MGAAEESGACLVCGKRVILKCSNCKQEYYCGKDHQREDWPRHKSSCRAFEIRENKELGRHLVAARDLRKEDIIVSEVPLVWGPAAHTSQRVCVGCGQQCTQNDEHCSRCMWPACSPNCAGLLDKSRHGWECAILAKTRIFPRCDVLLVIRMLLLWASKSKRWMSLANLQSHEESRKSGTMSYEEVENVTSHLLPLISINPSAKDILPKICGLIDVNALETNPPNGSVAIYETVCLLEHCCLANTRHSFTIDDKGRPRITVKAIMDIKKGEHLSTMYTHALWSTRARREHLMETKYFSCGCKRCADPTELGTHMSTLVCPCKNGFVLPKDPLSFDTEWSCSSCPGILEAAEVAELTNRLEEEVEEAMKVASKDTLSDLLARLIVLLHPGHQHCISVSHSLMQLLAPSGPRKAELCKRIIDTVTVLDPYGARLPLYMAIALRELARCPGEDKKTLLSRAAALLKPEPVNSPGGKFLKLINSELSDL